MPVIQTITTASGTSAYVPTSRQLTINGVTYDLTADRSWTIEVLDNLIATAPLSYNSVTNTISISQAGASTNGFLSSADWLTFSSKQNAITLTTTGNNGAATLVGATLNIPEYTLAGLGGFSNPMTSLGDIIYGNAVGLALRRAGNTTTTKMFLSSTGDGTNANAPVWEVITPATINAVPTNRTITINGTTFDLSANRSWSVGTVTSIGLSSTTSGITIGSSPVTSSGTITIDIAIASSSSNGLLSSTDWTTFNSKMNNPFTSLGDIVYSNAAGAPIRRAGNITTTKMFLSQTGDGTSSAAPIWSVVTASDTGSVPISRTLTINGTSYDLSANRSWSVGSVTSVDITLPTGLSVIGNPITTSGTLAVTFSAGYSIPTTAKQTEWDLAYTNRITSLTTSGTSGAATLISNTLNIPNYTLSGLGGVPTTRTLTINGTTHDLSADRTFNVGTVTSVNLTMPSAFSVSGSPITSSGTLAVTATGNATQYIRGDGALADFPTSVGGGGASVSYYLNGSVNQGTFGGNVYYEMDKSAVIGSGTDFTIGANGYIASFITDANVPNAILIPSGNWNLEFYFSASSSGGSPSFYVELYKYDGTTFTLIASNSTSPELIAFGTTINPYFSSLAVPETTLAVTDRLALRIYVIHSGRTITLHTEDNHLCQIITTFTTGLTALNNLTKQVQYLATGTSGTDFNISSVTDTHTFNLPTASATNRGALSTTDWTTFNSKQNALNGTGFVKISGTTISYDNSTYYLASNPSAYITLTSLSAGAGISYNNTTGVISSTITQYTDALARASISETITGIDYNNTTGVFSITAGYGIPTTTSQTNWDTAYTNRITSLTTTGSSGAATLISNTLNIPNYTAAGLGAVPTSRTITINDVVFDLSANRSWDVGDFGTW